MFAQVSHWEAHVVSPVAGQCPGYCGHQKWATNLGWGGQRDSFWKGMMGDDG